MDFQLHGNSRANAFTARVGQRAQRSTTDKTAVLRLTCEGAVAQGHQRPDRGKAAFLVGHPGTVLEDARAQFQRVLMVCHVGPAPGVRAHRLGAHLLGDRHRVGLDLAVGVVRSHGQPPLAVSEEQHRLGLAGTGGPQHLHLGRLRQQAVGGAVVQRHRGGRRHADLLELVDVVLDRSCVAARPAGNHQLPGGDGQDAGQGRGAGTQGFAGKGER